MNRSVPTDVRLLLLILVVMLPARIFQTANVRSMSIDGGYLTEVARHVRDGHGLVTNMSVYNFGYESFPHPTAVYPLWPLLLGYSARVADLETLAHWLPFWLSTGAVVAAFLFGKRLSPAPIFPSVSTGIHGGHVTAILLAFNPQFIHYTSIPYTEGLSWLLLFVYAWRLIGTRDETSSSWAVEQAVWLSLLFFARAQFLVVPMALAVAVGARLVVGPDRFGWARLGLISLGLFGGALFLWWLYLRTFVVDPGLTQLLRFDQSPANHLLTEFDVIVPTDSVMSALTDRLSGVGLSYHIASPRSWIPSFGAAALALPFAAVFSLAAWFRGKRNGLSRRVAALRASGGVSRFTLVMIAVGSALSVYATHKHFAGDWYFSKRQGMIALWSFLLPMLWLLRQEGYARAVGTILLSATLTGGVLKLAREGVAADKEASATDKFGDLVGWLNQHGDATTPVPIAMNEGTMRKLAWRTQGIGYHAIISGTPAEDLEVMVEKLGVRYLILPSTRRGYSVCQGGAIEANFDLLPERPSGYYVLKARQAPAPAPAPRPRVLLVGVDGLSWTVMGPMIAEGRLPNFGRLMQQGASLTTMDGLGDKGAATEWTTIATGRTPEDHGGEDEAEFVNAGGEAASVPTPRSVPALWDIARAAGRTVDVVNWPVRGATVAPAPSTTLPSATAAAAASPTLATQPAPAATPALEPVPAPVADPARAPEDTPQAWFDRAQAADAGHVAAAVAALRSAPKDLTLVYLHGPDPIQHLAWSGVEPFRYASPPTLPKADAALVQASYRYLDASLAQLLDAAGPDVTVIVVSAHGAEPCTGKKITHPGCHSRTAKGMGFFGGQGALPGEKLATMQPTDIFPTVAWLQQLPIAEELPGRIRSEGFRWEYAARFGRTEVATYGPWPPTSGPR